MLKDEDRIFQNLYNDSGSDVDSSKKRGDWISTLLRFLRRVKSGLLDEIKSSELRGRGGAGFPTGLKMVICP